MLGLHCRPKLGCTKNIGKMISSILVEPRMYSAMAKHLKLNCGFQFHKNITDPTISFPNLKRECLSRHLSICDTNLKAVTSLDEEPSHDKGLNSLPGGKIHRENEAEFHHKIMEDCSSYSSTIFKPDPQFTVRYKLDENEFRKLVESENWENNAASSLAKAFASLGVYSSSVPGITFEDERLDGFMCGFLRKCSSFSDDELIDCLIALQHWAPSQSVRDEQFLKVWKALDQVCHERYIDWSHDKILYMVDLWYQMRLVRLSIFVYKALKKISNKCEDITKAQMVQVLFYMSCARKIHPAISMREYEYNMEKYITHMTVEEIGIFALAFFKTKTSILNQKLLVYTMNRVVEEIDSIHQITLTAIAKAVRFSHKPAIGFTSNDFVNNIVQKKMDSLELINAIHILHITSQVQFFNPEAITKLAEKFYHNPSQARLKDIERVVFVLSLFNYIPPSTPDILDVVLEEIEKPQHQRDAENFPLIMISLVYFMSLLQRFPENIIRQIVNDESLLKKSQSKFMIPMQAMQLDFNRVLEGPPGSEYLLSEHLREYLARRYSEYLPDVKYKKPNGFDQMMLEVMDLSKEVLGGEKYCLVTRPLPHFSKADILFRLDEAGNPLEISEEMRSKVLFKDVIRAPDPTGWFCVVIGGRNMYMHNLPRLIGEQVAKHRQLKILGYNTITLPNHYWKAEKNKADYLKLKYFTRTN